MNGAWNRILQRYGQRVTVHREGEQEGTACRAFLQPQLECRGEDYQSLPTPLGLVRQDRWIYLGEPQVSLDGLGDGYVEWDGRKFSIRGAQPIYIAGTLAYWWALLVLRDPEGA